MLYFDNNATTKVAQEVTDFMLPFFSEEFANPSALYTSAQKARAVVEESRLKAAEFLNCSPEEVYFTSGGTESDNLAILGAANANTVKRHIITTAIEHPAVKNPVNSLRNRGYTVSFIPVDSDGVLDLDILKKSITKDTLLVSVMVANNETGVLQPIEEAAQIAHAYGALFHTDAVNAAGKILLDVQKSGCDMLSVSAHKMHGPKGAGILYLKNGTPIDPVMYGSQQERGIRPGTENVPLIAGMGRAFELASNFLTTVKQQRQCTENAQYLENVILTSIPGSRLNGSKLKRVWNTMNIQFDNVEAEGLIIHLDLAGAAISGGSACASGSLAPSPVLTAMGLSKEESRSSVRISLSRYTTRQECRELVELLKNAVENLRAASAY